MSVHLSSWLLWTVYAFMQFFHIFVSAFLSIRSKLNAVNGYMEYFRLRWPPILARLILTTMAFVVIWDNPKLLGLSSNLISGHAPQICLAGILGWFSDSAFDKLMAIIPGMNRELPPVEFKMRDDKNP